MSHNDPSFDRLIAGRLVIRRFAPDDAATFAAYRSDPAVARYQDWACPFPLVAARDFIARQSRRAPGAPGIWFQFAVTLAGSGALIGDVGLLTVEDDRNRAEVGFTLATAHHGQGYATEAVRAVVQYAFDALGLSLVCARTDPRNVPAQRLLERCGFRRDAEAAEELLYVHERSAAAGDRLAAGSGQVR